MRCKCCNTQHNVSFVLDDWYCGECAGVIKETIIEDRSIHELVPSWMCAPKDMPQEGEEE